MYYAIYDEICDNVIVNICFVESNIQDVKTKYSTVKDE